MSSHLRHVIVRTLPSHDRHFFAQAIILEVLRRRGWDPPVTSVRGVLDGQAPERKASKRKTSALLRHPLAKYKASHPQPEYYEECIRFAGMRHHDLQAACDPPSRKYLERTRASNAAIEALAEYEEAFLQGVGEALANVAMIPDQEVDAIIAAVSVRQDHAQPPSRPQRHKRKRAGAAEVKERRDQAMAEIRQLDQVGLPIGQSRNEELFPGSQDEERVDHEVQVGPRPD